MNQKISKTNLKDVIIIGAGAAGLYAGYLLKAQGFDVQILEANNRVGGRIKSLEDFTDFPVELGAMYLHGDKNLFSQLIDYMGVETSKIPENGNFAYYKKQLLDFKSSNKRRKLGKALRFFKKSHLYSKAEQTAHEFASKKKYFDSAELILEGLASEYGTDLRKIGMKSLAKEENLWHSGSEDYVFNQSILSIFSEITAELSEETQLNTVVKKVAYQANQVEITDSNQQKYLAKKVIVTVPLSVLKANLIEFTPNLPPAKLEAIQRIGFDIGMKVVLQFKSSFWSEEMTYLLGGENCPIYEVLAMGRETEKPVLCAYLMGRFANKLGELPETKVVETLLAELDKLFPQLETKPSELLEKSFQMDWGKEPHIWGAYSFASPHSEGMREVLAEPIQQTIYFSGEATHFDGHAATVHGAMEMSEWVVERIMEEEKEK